MAIHSVERRAEIVFAKHFSLKKEPNFSKFFETDVTCPIAYCLCQLLRSSSANTIGGTVCLSPVGEFLTKKFKTQIFSEGKCYFFHNSLP